MSEYNFLRIQRQYLSQWIETITKGSDLNPCKSSTTFYKKHFHFLKPFFNLGLDIKDKFECLSACKLRWYA